MEFKKFHGIVGVDGPFTIVFALLNPSQGTIFEKYVTRDSILAGK